MKCHFKYQKLSRSRREIRLLELLPDNHHLSKFRPACRMFHTSLDMDPPFLALSYVWGDENDKRVILVDKRPFRVTRNLFEALMGLRETESLIVWIDAICINQLDDEEKGWQVSLMGDLYQAAFGVLAWLGTPADNSDTVMDYLNVLGDQAEACGLDDSPEGAMHIWQAIITTPSYMDDPGTIVIKGWLDGRPLLVSKYALERLLHSIGGWKSHDQLLPIADLARLFRRAWWGRVWVLQEIALPEHAYFACGTKRISRRRFRAAFNAYYALWNTLAVGISQHRPLTAYQAEVFLMASHRAHVMLSMSHIYQIERFPLVALLRATCVGSVHHLKQDGHQHLISTDPRDKVFALLGLAEDRQELKTLSVFPDYSRSKEEVYITTMAALLQQGHISMLSLCRASEIPGTLPSWVPDWSVPMPETLQDVKPDHLTLYPNFNASGSKRQCQVIISKKDYELEEIRLLASIYDRVLQVGDVPRMPVTGTCLLPVHWLYEILRLTYIARNIYKDFNERLRAVIRTSHSATGYREDATLGKVDRFLDALPVLKSGIQVVKRQDMKRDLQGFFTSKEVGGRSQHTWGDPSRLFHDFMRISPRRSPFVTARGHLGLTSQYVRKGDMIAVFSGGQVPFILRQHDSGKYKIISEAYVDGIMDGEAVESSKWEYIGLM